MTSRGSPDSTIRPHFVRQPSRTRWLCTAAVASSAGIGRGVGRTGRAVGEHEDLLAQRDRARGPPAERVERALERRPPPRASKVQSSVTVRKRSRGSARSFARSPLVQHRLRHREAAGVVGRLVEQVALGADGRAQAHHERLALRVDGRVRDLREELLEEAAQQPRALRERGQRRVDAHRGERLLAVARHRRDDVAQLLGGVAEEAQVALERVLRGWLDRRRRDVLEVDLLLVEQRAVGAPACERALDLVVAADAPGVGVDDQHLPGRRRSLTTTSAGSRSSTPASDASTSSPSRVSW